MFTLVVSKEEVAFLRLCVERFRRIHEEQHAICLHLEKDVGSALVHESQIKMSTFTLEKLCGVSK